MKTNAIALQLAQSIQITECKIKFPYSILFSDRDEIFCEISPVKYAYIFKYGIVCFYNFALSEKETFLNFLKPYLKSPVAQSLGVSESLYVFTGSEKFDTDFDAVYLKYGDQEKIKLVMLNLSQSVALDCYASITEKLLEETRKHTTHLELKGTLNIRGKKLKRYIAKVMNVKNKISENLYIFDSPDIVWDDQYLRTINQSLKAKFDLKDRYQVITQQLNIIKENLELFKDIMFHKESSKLEWIIIILIVIEVIDLFVLKFIA